MCADAYVDVYRVLRNSSPKDQRRIVNYGVTLDSNLFFISIKKEKIKN